MLRWTAGVTRMDRIRNDAIRQKFEDARSSLTMLVFLVDRLFYVAVMHVAAEMAKSDALIDVNNCLRVTIAAMRRIAIDPVAFALLNAVVFSDCASSYLCERTIAHLREERERNVEALGLHLFERYQAEGASRMADHLSLIWSLLNDCCALRRHLLSSLPPSSFTSHILSLRTRFT
ncbi:unnamed protein product [Heligmosomoides polygyrus]|uniref:NR LBD domain-containing protein n=1 Tax=Heligmosomoides polygyrus TaxID=6339 RepID=A0A183FXE6_HELPZ|nr:unnamed protein product [Heligmosomoides polygyrus]